MALDFDDEILQDFLIEATEIMDRLDGQLVALESAPVDHDLLNAIFRGFHTIKGGAGFLAITPMVELCHKGEDVFNLLRQGERVVDAQMMDTFLKVLDTLNQMFNALRSAQMPNHAAPEILAELSAFLAENYAPVPAAQPAPEPQAVPSANDEITEEEFEALLDALHGDSAPGQMRSSKSEDPEFEALLDTLQGTHSTVTNTSPAVEKNPARPAQEHQLPQTEGFSPAAVAEPPKPQNTATNSGHGTTAVENSIRVETARLDEIMNLVGELVLVRNRINTLESTLKDEEMAKAVNHLTVVTADLQTSVMKTRMQPIKKVFGRFPRVVRDLARSLGKEIELQLEGEDTDLDKNLVEALADPLVHLVRNAVDHGVEMPDVREAAGKPRQGLIVLSARQEGEHILLSIRDDGAGMNAQTLRQKAIERGMMDADTAARLTQSECFSLIFAPGFSMKQEISDISGRGVGMDVVKTSINRLNGVIEIDSDLGRGTTLTIKVPLTLAIMPTLMVMLNQQIFALPLVNVNEIFHFKPEHTHVVDGQLTLLVRQKPMPLFDLHPWLTPLASAAPASEQHVVVVNIGTERVAFVVGELIGQEEVVIKPLGALLQGTKGLAGATITGDGRIALILDFPELMEHYAGTGF